MLNRKNLEALSKFRDRCDWVATYTSVIPQENSTEKTTRIKNLLNSYEQFVVYYFPHYAKSPLGWFHKEAAKKILHNKQAKMCLCWARGHAKSTHADIFIPLFLKFKKDLRVMVLVGKNEEAAQTLLSDLQAELVSNERILNDFGLQLRHGSWEKGRFATTDNCAFFALGRGQSPRGLRHRQYRPDYIVLDDIDDDELCRNPKRVKETYQWALKAVYGTSDAVNCRFIVANNLIDNNSVLANFMQNPSFETIIVRLWELKDHKKIIQWHEKISPKEADEMVKVMGHTNSQAEYFHNPIKEGSVINEKWIHYRNSPDITQYNKVISYLDPSFKNTDTSDYKAIITIGQLNGVYDIIHVFVRKCSLLELVTHWYDYHKKLPDNAKIEYMMEANFMQDMLLQEFKAEGIKRGWQLPLRRDHRKKPDKFYRIQQCSIFFENEQVFIDNAIKNTEDCKTFIDQLLSFEKGSRGHDDGPDAMEGALFYLNQQAKKSFTNIKSGKYTFKNNRKL